MPWWTDSTTPVQLKIGWKPLGLDEKKVRLTTPETASLQAQQNFWKNEQITVEKNQGCLLLLRE